MKEEINKHNPRKFEIRDQMEPNIIGPKARKRALKFSHPVYVEVRNAIEAEIKEIEDPREGKIDQDVGTP